MKPSLVIAVAAVLVASGTPVAHQAAGRTHQDLVALYQEFTQFRVPEMRDGVPDYTAPAMARQMQGLRALQARLAAFDTAAWPIAARVDHAVVKAEMAGMEFDHRVLRPWSRDPAFYVVINFQFGPKMHGAAGLPSLPIPANRIAATRERLRAIPLILDQARLNLTEPAADLALLGVRSKTREEGLLVPFVEGVRQHHSDLVTDAERALASVRSFRDWLDAKRPTLKASSGIGKDHFTWFMNNVLLLPYSWAELETITQRDLERALATMALEEHKNRKLPPLPLVTSEADYSARHVDAQRALLGFLERENVMTVPNFIQVAPPTGFQTGPLDYFQQVNYRDPMPLMPHDFMAHGPDARRRNADTRPIRGARRLYFVDSQRQDGLATALEQVMMHLGTLDNRPRARELALNLLALRAVRAMADLRMHSNQMSIMEAFQYNIDNTPKGWLPKDSATMWHDLELYLRQPGYGVGYLIGIAQFDRLLAERAKQLGPKFDLKQFMDDFLAAGLIPIELIRWEMTGTR